MKKPTDIALKREGQPIPGMRRNSIPSMQQVIQVDDQYDVAVFASTVHGYLQGVSEDYTLADLTPGQREYITEMYKLALLFRNFVPDKDVGERIFHTIMADSAMRCVLKRNTKDNFLLKLILGAGNTPEEAVEVKSETKFEKLINKLGKKSEKEDKEEKE